MRKIAKPRLECDRRMLLIVVALTAVGASLVASSSSYFSAAQFSDPYFLLKKHLERIVVAFLAMVIAMRIDYRLYRRIAPVVVCAAASTLVGLFVFGHIIRGAQSSYVIGSIGVSVQPSEFARLALVLFLAYWTSRVGTGIEDPVHGYLPAAGAVVVIATLIAAQRDLGTALATTAIGFVVLFVGGAKIRHIAATAGIMAAGAAIRVATTPYLLKRFIGYFNRSDHLADVNWQVHQSLISLGSGGIFGIGFGGSRQKLDWLPDSHTDFIFSILGEEAGIVGTVAVSLLFLLLAARALKISTRTGDRFGEMLVVGIGSSVFVYAALNMLVATGLFPVTGLPLPFMSYGGSALVANALSVGVLLNVSKKSAVHGVNYAKRRRHGSLTEGASCGS
jgi:cell division protein FtsW